MPLMGGGVSPGGLVDHHSNPAYKKDPSGYSMSDRYSGPGFGRNTHALPQYSSYSMYEDGPNIFDR